MEERKLNRLKDCDYSKSGYYFVTVCTRNREEWFGKIENGEMHLNTFGEIAEDFWAEIPLHFQRIEIDEFSVMPNHVHGILVIEKDGVGNAYMRSLQNRMKMLLSRVIQQYKASVTRRTKSLQGGVAFGWQKSFHDRIIRNEESLNNLRQYILYNPLKWELDIENRSGSSRHKRCVDYYGEIMGKTVGNAYMRSLHLSNFGL
jgi:REP element-mobilizing transposase RayT